MTKKICLTLFIFTLQLCVSSQINFKKVVVDSKTNLPLEFVNIYSENRKNDLLTDKKGNFTLDFNTDDKVYIFNKTGYYVQSVSKQTLLKMDTIFLVQQPVQLNEVNVTVKKLEEVVKDKRFYVDDYLVLPNSDFLIITYKINIKGFEVAYYKRNRGITCSQRIKNEFDEHLFKDCFSNFHLVTHSCSRQFYFTSDSSFEFLPPCRKTNFDSTLSKVVVRLDSQLIYKTDYPSRTYHGTYFNTVFYSPYLTYISLYHKKLNELYTAVYDKKMRGMIRSELGDSRRVQQELESEKIDISSYSPSVQSREAANSMFIDAVGPVYAPLFNKNDTLIVLNFQESEIVFLNRYGAILRTVTMPDFAKYHHFQAYYDEIKQKFYITMVEPYDLHVIKCLNVYTGKFDRTIGLERPFPKNIQIIDNKMYFQVKEHEWDDTSYIYQQNF